MPDIAVKKRACLKAGLKMTPAVVAVLFFITLTSLRPLHDYFVSVTQIQFNGAEKNLEISIRVFTDDLEKTLSIHNGNRRFSIRNQDQNDAFVEKYIKKHFILSDSKKQPQPLKFVGKENEADATWLYLEVVNNGNLSGFSLKNDILMDVFEDQVNMVNLKLASGRKTFLFKKGKSEQTF